jgi:phage baseplate assembly protein W
MATYSDLTHRFVKHPGTNDAVRLFDVDAAKASLKSILLTKYYEKLFNPEFGVNISGLLFENFSPITGTIVKRMIRERVAQYEPRITIDDINVVQLIEANSISIELYFYVTGTKDLQTAAITLERIR